MIGYIFAHIYTYCTNIYESYDWCQKPNKHVEYSCWLYIYIYNSAAGRLLGIDIFFFFLPGSLLGYRWCPMLDLSKKNSANIWKCHGHIQHFRVLCCFLSIFLASVLVRVLHPCVALATQKLLRGCCLLMGRAHLTDTMLFICLCTLLLWLDYRKHLAGTLLLQLRMEVTA